MMDEETLYRTPAAGPEMDRVRQILTQAFSFPEKAWESYVRRIGPGNFRIQRKEGRVAGALAILPFAHVIGGRAVAAGGIAAVGVPPEERRGGVALRLMQNVLRELRGEGLAVSSLFPATIALYRKAGYELAGANVRYRARIGAIPIRTNDLPVHRIPAERSAVLEQICAARAAASSGHLERSQALWERLTDPRDKELFAYLIGPKERPEGFVIYHQESAPGGYDLIVRDMAALTPASTCRLWSFIAGHATQGRYVQWTGPAVERLFYVLPEFQVEVVGYEPWMLRILDPVRALEARGYPPGLAATIHLRLDDDLFPENTGAFVLEVEGGRGTVRPGGRGELAMDIRLLASLYTGFLQPAQLRTVAPIDGKPEVLAAAASVFQAPVPWMPDYF